MRLRFAKLLNKTQDFRIRPDGRRSLSLLQHFTKHHGAVSLPVLVMEALRWSWVAAAAALISSDSFTQILHKKQEVKLRAQCF